MASKGELGLVFGAQWGDEGKGRIVDCLSNYDVYARFAGGDNAGHTVTVGNEIFKLHLTPSAITRPHSVVLIGRGVVVNPKTLVEEINGLRERGIDINPIIASNNPILILDEIIPMRNPHNIIIEPMRNDFL